jgi:GntR family transcriptional regulator
MSLPLHYFRLASDSTLPLYQQIQDNITQLIDDNLLRAGDALPPERQLSELYGVNRMTVRQAIDGLVRRGLIERRAGAGSFVAKPRPIAAFKPSVIGFSQQIREAGMTPSSRLLHREIVTPEPMLVHRLRLKPDDPVIVLKRLRLVNDEPLMLETSYLSYGMFPGLMEADLENESLYRILKQEYGMEITGAEHTLEPTLPTAYEAYHLGVPLTAPAMLVRVLAFSYDNVPIESSKAIVRGDRCRYFFGVSTRIPIME